jgi:hypothetical protein
MAFAKNQPRGPDGKWIPTGAAKKVRRSAKSKANKKAYQKKRRSKAITIDKASSRQHRGVGLEGLKKNFIPYARVSKKSATIGANTGTFLPGTNKRVVFGQYARIETVNKTTKVDSVLKKGYKKLAPEGTRRALVGEHIKKNVKLDNPALRYETAGTSSRNGIQARLGTSRKAGPTVTVRRGTHKRRKAESKAGIKRYDKQVNKKKKAPKSRPTRRKQAAAKSKRKKKNT